MQKPARPARGNLARLILLLIKLDEQVWHFLEVLNKSFFEHVPFCFALGE
jgi:hypothetical protein